MKPGAKYEGEKFPPLCEQTLVDARLHDIVDAIDLSETQQHLIDEEDTDVAEETSEEVEADMLRKDPPGEPIPAFNIQSWKASWRRAFFYRLEVK